MRRPPHRIALERCERERLRVVEAVDECIEIAVAVFVVERRRGEEGARLVDDIGDAPIAGLDQQDGVEAVARAETGEDERLLDVGDVEEPLPRPGGLLSSEAQHVGDRCCRKAEQRAAVAAAPKQGPMPWLASPAVRKLAVPSDRGTRTASS